MSSESLAPPIDSQPLRRSRAAIGFLLRALVLLLVMMISAMTAMRFAIHGREAMVPDLTGKSVHEAEQAARSTGLLLVREDRFFSATVPEGRVISQVPAPQTRVRRGGRIRIAESMGPQKVSVPNVVGQSRRAAELNIARRGLELGAVAVVEVPGTDPHLVVAQSPSADANHVTSPKVSLLVAAESREPQFVVPNFTGRSLADVTALLESAGMEVARVSDATARPFAAPARPGTVIGQSPPPGQVVAAGTQFSLEVAR